MKMTKMIQIILFKIEVIFIFHLYLYSKGFVSGNQQNLSKLKSNKNEIFKPINDEEKKFIDKPTIRLKRTPIGGFKPSFEILNEARPINKEQINIKTVQTTKIPKINKDLIENEIQNYESKNKQLLKEIEVWH